MTNSFAFGFLLVLLAGAAAAAPPGITNEPMGFGEAKLGMSVAQVKEIYPSMTELDAEKVPGMYKLKGIRSFIVADQKIPDFALPAQVTLRFFDDKLWVVDVGLAENDVRSAVVVLTQRHGEPSSPGRQPAWGGKNASVRVVPGGYEITSTEFAALAGKRLMEEAKPKALGAGEAHEH